MATCSDGAPAACRPVRRLPAGSSSEAGFTLAALIVILTIMALVIAYTVPRMWSKVLQRDRDQQTLFAMKQYARAIERYSTAHGMPTSLDQLKQARKPRLVRGVNSEWVDPLTGEVDWILIPATAVTPLAPGAANDPTNPSPQNPNYGKTDTTATTAGTTTTGAGASTKNPTVNSGPFVGVRPAKTGKSYLTVNNATNYEDWIYTTQNLQNERAALQGIAVPGAPGIVPPTTTGSTNPTKP